MGSHEVDDYLAAVPAADRAALEELRAVLKDLVPEATECISYRVPALRLDGGAVVAGYAAFARHLSYLPFSGSTLERCAGVLGDRPRTKSSLHFTAEHPLPPVIVERLVRVRLDEIAERGR